ncbi:MAG TPA: hypothetical protein GYA10_05620 [Alphaproteobacteria bacterium]|nr:hypothetical protein [Alphaproteobacteria bacterium]
MAAKTYDYAICGATTFAGLLAGQLATAHGKRVCLVGEAWSPYRLTRGIDLSVMPATRPETWIMLKRSGAETLKVLGSIGRGLYERVDPLFVADLPASADYLGHMRWVALGLGFAAERAVDRTIVEHGAICRIRDAAMLVEGKAEPAIEAWLARAGVGRLAANAAITVRKDGVASIAHAGETSEAQTIILADDEALLGRLAPGERHRLLTVAPRTSLLADIGRPLGNALIAYLDRDTVLRQRAGKGPVLALAAGEPDHALPRIASCLVAQGHPRRAGQARFLTVGTRDGAPLIGRMGKGRFTAIAGLGFSAAFLAPLVARCIAGAAADEERAWFEARDVTHAGNRQSVAELVPAAELAP